MEEHIEVVEVLFFVLTESIGLQILLLSASHSMINISLNLAGKALDNSFDFWLIGILIHQF